MNAFSWLIYAIDVIGNLKGVAIGLIIVLGFSMVGYVLFGLFENDTLHFPRARWFALLAGAIFLAVVTPGTSTMYAIAALQIGERIAAQPDIQDISSDAMKAVRSWIKSQIKEEKDR